MKAFKTIIIALAILVVATVAVTGTVADQNANNNELSITNLRLKREGNALELVSQADRFVPVVDGALTTENQTFSQDFLYTDVDGNQNVATLNTTLQLCNGENVIDNISAVINTGNLDAYVRTWFAFEMGSASIETFEKCICINKNDDNWTWGAFEYGVEIKGSTYAVICAEYNTALQPAAITAPSLLQVMLSKDTTNNDVYALDGDADGNYKIYSHSIAVSDKNAWGGIQQPAWNEL